MVNLHERVTSLKHSLQCWQQINFHSSWDLHQISNQYSINTHYISNGWEGTVLHHEVRQNPCSQLKSAKGFLIIKLMLFYVQSTL